LARSGPLFYLNNLDGVESCLMLRIKKVNLDKQESLSFIVEAEAELACDHLLRSVVTYERNFMAQGPLHDCNR
jgi:hypothetical protein